MNILFSMGRKYRRVQVPFGTPESHIGANTAGCVYQKSKQQSN